MECDGKRAGDTCAADGGLGNCVPECDAQCLVCVAPSPFMPDPPVSAAGGCNAGGSIVLLVLAALVIMSARA